MVRILLADDHDLVREGIRRILEAEPDFRVVGEACDWDEVTSIIDDGEFDLLITDLVMPGKGAVVTIPEIQARVPDLPILVVSMYPEDAWEERVIELGARGFLNKSRSAVQLVAAVRTVLSGEEYRRDDAGQDGGGH